MNDPVHIFGAAEIASALGVKPQRVRQIMERIPACRIELVRGQETKKWGIAKFPPHLREQLARLARNTGCRDVEHLLLSNSEPWQPDIPLAQVDESQIDKAKARRDVLAPILNAHHTERTSLLVRRAQDVMAITPGFGLQVDRTIRLWIDTAKERDKGRLEWERIELYLDKKLSRRPHDNPLAMIERAQRILSQGGPKIAGLNSADFTATAGSEWKKFTASISDISKSGVFSMAEFKNRFLKELESPEFLALPEDVRRKLQNVGRDISAAIPAEVKTPDPSAEGTPTSGEASARPAARIEADRFAKVGLFIGGGGPALDYARQTARGIQRLVDISLKSGGLTSGHLESGPVGAVWY